MSKSSHQQKLQVLKIYIQDLKKKVKPKKTVILVDEED
jgi:hypothetical protein